MRNIWRDRRRKWKIRRCICFYLPLLKANSTQGQLQGFQGWQMLCNEPINANDLVMLFDCFQQSAIKRSLQKFFHYNPGLIRFLIR